MSSVLGPTGLLQNGNSPSKTTRPQSLAIPPCCTKLIAGSGNQGETRSPGHQCRHRKIRTQGVSRAGWRGGQRNEFSPQVVGHALEHNGSFLDRSPFTPDLRLRIPTTDSMMIKALLCRTPANFRSSKGLVECWRTEHYGGRSEIQTKADQLLLSSNP